MKQINRKIANLIDKFSGGDDDAPRTTFRKYEIISISYGNSFSLI